MKRHSIVIFDDSPVNIQILIQTLISDYKLIPFGSVDEGIKYLEKNHDIDIILLDIDMPLFNGYDAFKIIKQIPDISSVPVIFVTARTDVESEISAFDLGIVDYIKKPIVPAIAKKRIDFHIKYRNREKSIIEESNSIKRLTEVTIKTLISLVDQFNGKPENHISRIISYVTVLSEKMMEKGMYKDEITPEFIEKIRLAAPFHDCGKIYISEKILAKPAKLTEDEYIEVQKHTVLGSGIMKKAREMMGIPSFYDMAEKLVLHYHERWDGTGYPYKIKGNEIPLCARVMIFADVYDALITEKPYKESYTHSKAVEIILSEKGKAFDPDICDVFHEINEDFRKISLAFS